MRTFDSIQTELRAGRINCEQLTQEYLDAIEAGRTLNVFISVFPEKALEQARAVDRKLSGGTEEGDDLRSGRLSGVQFHRNTP
jgi:aspartyl-tRNA(Asn)/glutamyl-tRNA(Gln) amidotransferase subunit A